jgi:hypothetical protein
VALLRLACTIGSFQMSPTQRVGVSGLILRSWGGGVVRGRGTGRASPSGRGVAVLRLACLHDRVLPNEPDAQRGRVGLDSRVCDLLHRLSDGEYQRRVDEAHHDERVVLVGPVALDRPDLEYRRGGRVARGPGGRLLDRPEQGVGRRWCVCARAQMKHKRVSPEGLPAPLSRPLTREGRVCAPH